MTRRHIAAMTTAVLLLAGGCGGSDKPTTTQTTQERDADAVELQVASYDLAANRDQRFIVGLVAPGGKLVSFGEAELAFVYLAPDQKSLGQSPQPGPTVQAAWIPVPGQKIGTPPTESRVVSPSDGAGVYRAAPVRFDKPGIWGVTATIRLDGKVVRARNNFPVGATTAVVAAGEDAPRTENHLPGAASAPPKAVDSRAEADGAVPDPELHGQTVAAAIASGRPTMVVVSTPVYCVSRFCGPVTDSVQQLAKTNASRMNFVHIEVWRNFENKEVNKAAAEWIFRDRAGDINEPWVFLVGGDGKVVERWDNVAADEELSAAVDRATT